MCIADQAADGQLSLDEQFRDEGTGEACLDFDRASWPHGDWGPAKPHSMVFVTADDDIRGAHPGRDRHARSRPRVGRLVAAGTVAALVLGAAAYADSGGHDRQRSAEALTRDWEGRAGGSRCWAASGSPGCRASSGWCTTTCSSR